MSEINRRKIGNATKQNTVPASKNLKQPKKRKTKYSKWVSAIAIFLCLLLVGAGGAVAWIYKTYKDIGQDPLAHFKKDLTAIVDPEAQPSGSAISGQGIINILLLGIDSSAERSAQSMGWRSDVMIVCSIDTTANKMSMLTIPRDTYTNVNHLNKKTGAVTSRSKDKIAHAYSYGGGPKAYGAQNAIAAVEEYLSCDGKYPVKIHYYASIDMDGFPKLADAVGGVDVVLTDSYPGGYKAGDTFTVTSKNADDFVRNRKEGGHGDDGRNERQQLFLIAFMKKVKAMGAVKTATKIYNEAISYIHTDMSLEQVIALAKLFEGFDIDGIDRYRLVGNGKMINGAWFDIIPEDELESAVVKYLYRPKES